MKTFVFQKDKMLQSRLGYTLTLKRGQRLPVWGCENSLKIDINKKQHELFYNGYGRFKISKSLIELEDIPDLEKPFTDEQFKEYANEYSIECAREFLDCCNMVKPQQAWQVFNPPANKEIWEDRNIQDWFETTFKQKLVSCMCGYSMVFANVYALDILKFEKLLAFRFGYPMHENGSMKDFMRKKFGKEATNKFESLFLKPPS